MMVKIEIGEITVEVVRKNIKNLHLSVYPPIGNVCIVAPLHMKLDRVRIFAISKLGWIKQQQRKLRQQERDSAREYLDRESHYVWGRRYLLKIIESDHSSGVELKHRQMHLRIRPGATDERKQAVVESWYRAQLKQNVPAIIEKWEALMGVKVAQFFVQKMKTKWGSCNPGAKNIRLNTELAKKSPEYLEYIIVHEMAHFLESTHNHRFIALMDRFMPKWRFYREELNRTALSHEQWKHL